MSSVMFRNNARVLTLSRVQGVDRYSQPTRGVVPGMTDFRIHLDRSTSLVRGLNGDTSTVDGTAIVASRFDVQKGDLLELTDGTKWEVFSEGEALDVVNARAVHRVFNLTKQRKND